MECVDFPAFMNILKFAAGKATIRYENVDLNAMIENSEKFREEVAKINDPDKKSCGPLVKFLVEYDHPLVMKAIAEYNKRLPGQQDEDKKG